MKEVLKMLVAPRDQSERPILTKADQERFLKWKAEVDAKIQKIRERIQKELESQGTKGTIK